MTPAFDLKLSPEEVASAFPVYTDVHELKSGGQGCVFNVCRRNGDRAALKIYDMRRAEMIRIEREIEALKRLKSDVVVKLYEFGEVVLRDASCVFTLCEYVQGHDLEELIKSGPLPQELVVRICINLSYAIDELWSHRIVHRDIKPANILVQNDGAIRLIDLGIARYIDETTVTPPGYRLGTPRYMSPEQFSGRKSLTFKSDLFTLGIVAYEAVTGKHPFQSDERYYMIGAIAPTPISVPGVSAILVKVIGDMMQFHPANRPATGQIIRDQLRTLA